MLTCDKCGKSFDSYRKLNGHKGSHSTKERKKRVKPPGSPMTRREYLATRRGNHSCSFCGKLYDTGPLLGNHVRMCPASPKYIERKEKLDRANKQNGLDPAIRQKISEANKRFLTENPEMVPYLRNHSSKKSYPEKIFENLLTENGISGWKYNFQHGPYVFDFAFPEIKLDVEIDGSQHQSLRHSEHDRKRDEYSTSCGWHVLRIKAKDVRNRELQMNIVNHVREMIEFLRSRC